MKGGGSMFRLAAQRPGLRGLLRATLWSQALVGLFGMLPA